MIVKVKVRTSTKEILFAEAGEDFDYFVFCFLAFGVYHNLSLAIKYY